LPNEISIPEYTAEEYASSDKPYEWLYAHRKNKFLLKQLTQRMKDQAGKLGVKSFVGLFNAYCESMAASRGESLERATLFDGQPAELLSGEYVCDEKGVRVIDKFGYEQMVCPHPILPIQRLENVDSGEERMEIAYKKGLLWRTIIVEKTTISSSSKILDLAAYGVIVNSENAKALSTYLFAMEQLNYAHLPEKRSVGRLGWISNHGFSPYLGELEFDGEAMYKHIFSSVKQSGEREKWISAMKNVRAEKTAGRIFLAASFASAILEPCGLLPFFVHLWGGQGTGKTVSLMIAASVWACPKLGEYISSFNSTDVGQEMTISFLNSLPLCMDELQIQAASGIREFDRMIYKLTEGFGKVRGAKAGGLRQTATWRNCILTTGEHPILNANSMGGASVRVIEIECAEKVYSDLVGLCAVINENYGFAGREFVEHLQKDGMIDKVNALQKELYRELLTIGEDKQAASASAILAADQIATEIIFQDGNALSVEEISAFLTKKDEVNANVRALEYIFELVGRNPMHFRTNDYGEYRNEVWGKVDQAENQDCVYIIKSVFDREMSLAGFNSTSFLSWAKRNGHLVCDKDGNRNTKKARVGGSLVNTVCILLSDIQQVSFEQEISDVEDGLPL